jgi:hypothetical protein
MVKAVACDTVVRDRERKQVGIYCVYDWGSSVSILSDYRLDDRGSIRGRGNGLFL